MPSRLDAREHLLPGARKRSATQIYTRDHHRLMIARAPTAAAAAAAAAAAGGGGGDDDDARWSGEFLSRERARSKLVQQTASIRTLTTRAHSRAPQRVHC